MKKAILLLIVLMMTALGFAAWANWAYSNKTLVFDKSPVRVVVDRGASLRAVGSELRKSGVSVPDRALAVLARIRPETTKIQAGTYRFEAPMTLEAVIAKMMAGDVLTTQIRFIEGWTLKQMRAEIAANCDVVHDDRRLSHQQLAKKIGSPADLPEGLFFPSTYRVAVGSSALDVYRRAFDKMDKVLQAEWKNREANLPLKKPYDALVLASVVEKETGTEADRTVIAGVFINRLRIGMKLQSDPTTIYGLGDAFDGDLRRRDLRRDTPYNTYTRYGLPPTPIAMPGLASIKAVLHPAKTKAIYFVARGDGSSQFSVTLAQHNRAVRKYQLGKP